MRTFTEKGTFNDMRIKNDERTRHSAVYGGSRLRAERRRNQIARRFAIDAVDQVLLRQLTEFPNTTLWELGALVGMSATTVNKRNGKPAFQRAQAEAFETNDARLDRAANRAIRRLDELTQSRDECSFALNLTHPFAVI